MTAPATVQPTLQNFITEFLGGLGISNPTPGDYAALEQVAKAEGQNNYYNPFNTTQLEPGSTSVNSVGVQSYTSLDQGAAASATLFQDQAATKAGIPAALKSGNQASIDAAFKSFYASWGSDITFSALTPASGSQSVGPNPGTGVLPVGGGTTGSGSATSAVLNNPISGIEGDAESLYNDFTSLSFWVRIGFILIGVVLLIVGIDKLIGGGLIPSSSPAASTTPEPGPTADVPAAVTPPPVRSSSKPSPYTPRHTERSGRHEQGGQTSSVGELADAAPEAALA